MAVVSTEHVPTRVHRHQLRQNLSLLLAFAVHVCQLDGSLAGKLYGVVKVKVKGLRGVDRRSPAAATTVILILMGLVRRIRKTAI